MIRHQTVTTINAPIERCFDLARSVEVHLAGNVHWGEQALAIAGRSSGLLGPGDEVTWQARHFNIRFELTSRITQFKRPIFFQDTMMRGPFRSIIHDHVFRVLPDGGTEVRDHFHVAAPVPVLGSVIEAMVLNRYMLRLLNERNLVLKRIAESDEWEQYLCKL